MHKRSISALCLAVAGSMEWLWRPAVLLQFNSFAACKDFVGQALGLRRLLGPPAPIVWNAANARPVRLRLRPAKPVFREELE